MGYSRLNSNETLANLWRTVDRTHQQQIETTLLKKNEGFIVSYLNRRHPPVGYRDICLSAICQSIIPALNGYDDTRGLKFLTYWCWWIKCEYNRIINEEVGLFPVKSVQRKTKVPIDISVNTVIHDGLTVEDTLYAKKEFAETQLCDIIDSTYDATTAQIFKYIISGYTRTETARVMGITMAKVSNIIFKNRAKIKELILESH